MTSIDQLRRDAKALRKSAAGGDPGALSRVRAHVRGAEAKVLKHANALHVIARERGFASWPALVAAVETHGMDRAARLQRLTIAMAEGQDHVVRALLAEDDSLAEANLALAAGFYRPDAVRAILAADPAALTRKQGAAPPFIHFCRSRMHRLFPNRTAEMLEIAELFRTGGIDVNAGLPWPDDPAHKLSPLYFALGHAGNLPLARWLLEHGADPNDGESLYHATELGNLDGLRLLLDHGADPKGTNALPRAMDFDDPAMVRLLLENGADPNEFSGDPIGGEVPFVVPALHQAARRMSSPEVVALLLDAGACPDRLWKGKSAYAYAAVYGHVALADRLAAMGADTTLTSEEDLMARAARGEPTEGFVDPAKLSEDFRHILRQIVHLPGKLPHIRHLVAVGVEYDLPDPTEGLTPVQNAGWEGLPDVMGYFLSLKPDLGHVNSYGGTLLSTILHGADNNPSRDGRDYPACLRLALEEGVALPRRALQASSDPEIAGFLADWAATYPGQVVEHGVV